MPDFELVACPLSECSNPVASNPARIIEIHCSSDYQGRIKTEQQQQVSIVTLKQRKPGCLELMDDFSFELDRL